MRSAHVLAVRVLLLGSLLAGAGCFRPKVLSGRYACGDAGACPDNYICDPSTNLCVGSIGGAGGKGGTGGKGGAGGKDAGPPDVPPDRPCIGAIASCPQSDAGLCDPVCNTGCGDCFEKCSVNTAGDLTCNAPTAASVGIFGQCCAQVTRAKIKRITVPRPEFCFTNGNECEVAAISFAERVQIAPTAQVVRVTPEAATSSVTRLPQIAIPSRARLRAKNTTGAWGHPTPSVVTFRRHRVRQSATAKFAGGRWSSTIAIRSRDCLPGLVCYDPTGGINSR